MINFRESLIKELISLKHDVYCFCIDYNTTGENKIKELGATPINYRFNRSKLNPCSDIINTFKLKKLISSISPDIVLSYFSKPSIYGSLAAKLAHVPKRFAMLEGLGYTFTEQKNGLHWRTKLIQKIQIVLYKISLSTTHGLILLNKDDKSDLIEKYNIKVRTLILGGIGLNLKNYEFTPIIKKNNISFIFVARLLKEKGIYEYIDAAKIVKKKYPGTIFHVLGGLDTDNPGGIKKEQLDELNNTGIINYPGFVINVNEWIKISDVFVLPSYYREGLPRSTQEAMSIGRPVITTNCPGCKETVNDGINGFLIPPWSPDMLAEKMIYFIENPEHIEIMGLKSYEIAKNNYDSKIVNEKLLKYMKIL